MSDVSRTFNGQQPISGNDLSTTRMSTRIKQFRDNQVTFDEFGREYLAIIDTGSKGIVDLMPQFSAPVNVPLIYCSIPPRKGWRLEIDWRQYVSELKRGENDWKATLARIMKDLYREASDGMAPTDRALTMVGVKPQDWRIVALAAMGDAWALGFQDARTARVVKLIGTAPWVPRTGSTDFDDQNNSYGLDLEMRELLGDDAETLVERGFQDERGRSSRRAPAIPKRVLEEADEDEGAGDLLEDEDLELDDDAMQRAAADLGDEPLFVPTIGPKAKSTKAPSSRY